jgi:hypothetical protein
VASKKIADGCKTSLKVDENYYKLHAAKLPLLNGLYLCRSERAREELKDAAFTLVSRVIVDVLRERARSYST